MWLGHPELRFTFDHIACETISQVLTFVLFNSTLCKVLFLVCQFVKLLKLTTSILMQINVINLHV